MHEIAFQTPSWWFQCSGSGHHASNSAAASGGSAVTMPGRVGPNSIRMACLLVTRTAAGVGALARVGVAAADSSVHRGVSIPPPRVGVGAGEQQLVDDGEMAALRREVEGRRASCGAHPHPGGAHFTDPQAACRTRVAVVHTAV